MTPWAGGGDGGWGGWEGCGGCLLLFVDFLESATTRNKEICFISYFRKND